MEDSQIAVLPPDLASEAQNLRREWETRNRQMLQDRFFSHTNHTTTTLSSILRNSGIARQMLDFSFVLHGHNSQDNRAGPLRPFSSILPFIVLFLLVSYIILICWIHIYGVAVIPFFMRSLIRNIID
jgi:hypothetical protein